MRDLIFSFIIIFIPTYGLLGQNRPTAICNSNKTFFISSNGCVEISAREFDGGSFDDVTPNDKLKFSFQRDQLQEKKNFCCQGLYSDYCTGKMPTKERTLYVFDEEGNVDSCQFELVMEDTLNVCPQYCKLTYAINIQVLDNQYAYYSLAKIYINGNYFSSFNLIGPDKNYSIDKFCLIDSTIRVELTRNDDPINGLTTVDVLKIKKHILGKQYFTNPYQYLAADVNQSKSISGSDMTEIRQLILGVKPEFSKVPAFLFYNADYKPKDPSAPYDIPPYVEWVQKDYQVKTIRFQAVKMGDIK
jgi:hypothetical protein